MLEPGYIEMDLGKNNDKELIDLYGKGIVKNDKEIEADNYAKENLCCRCALVDGKNVIFRCFHG